MALQQANQQTGHARACEAAGLAESARVQRGNEGFWKAHDALFARQAPNELLAKLDVAEVIAALGLDPIQTHAQMKSRAITERINEDVTLARNSGVTATPWLILNDKVVDGIAANDLNFWGSNGRPVLGPGGYTAACLHRSEQTYSR